MIAVLVILILRLTIAVVATTTGCDPWEAPLAPPGTSWHPLAAPVVWNTLLDFDPDNPFDFASIEWDYNFWRGNSSVGVVGLACESAKQPLPTPPAAG